MRCAIFGCNNCNQGANACTKGYYAFPIKNKKICKEWVFLSGRKDRVNTVFAKVCGDHFTDGDFKSNEMFDRYGLKYIKKLKPGAIP